MFSFDRLVNPSREKRLRKGKSPQEKGSKGPKGQPKGQILAKQERRPRREEEMERRLEKTVTKPNQNQRVEKIRLKIGIRRKKVAKSRPNPTKIKPTKETKNPPKRAERWPRREVSRRLNNP